MRRLATAVVCLALPAALKPPLLNALGHNVARSVRIGPSLVIARLFLAGNARIGPLNLIRTRRLVMRENAAIGCLNVIHGHISVWLRKLAMIGNRNVINQGPLPDTAGPALLRLGASAKITASHYVNVSDSVLLGAMTTLAGAGSQIWTHGFVNLPAMNRPMVRGKIVIGRNVYIGSQCCLSPGVTVADDIAVGAHSSVANSLIEPGVYVPARLRHIAVGPHERMAGLRMVADDHYRREGRPWQS